MLEALLHDFLQHLLFNSLSLRLRLKINQVIDLVAGLLRNAQGVHEASLGLRSAWLLDWMRPWHLLRGPLLGRLGFGEAAWDYFTLGRNGSICRFLDRLTRVNVVVSSHHTRSRRHAIPVNAQQPRVLGLRELVSHIEDVALVVLVIHHVVTLEVVVDELGVLGAIRRPDA